ncbi:MAG: hypothetical protein ABH822_02690 [Patescibacteria group bacterium]
MRYCLEYIGKDALEIHVNKRVRGHRVEAEVRNNPLIEEDPPSPGCIIIADALLSVDGVATVSLDSYSVTICKGKAFHWDELVLALLSALLFHLADNDDESLEEFAPPERRDVDLEEFCFVGHTRAK